MTNPGQMPPRGDAYPAAYAALGLSVIRAFGVINGRCSCGRTACPSAGKHPDVGGSWKAYTEVPADLRQVKEWFGG
jgi:hypothetical protein